MNHRIQIYLGIKKTVVSKVSYISVKRKKVGFLIWVSIYFMISTQAACALGPTAGEMLTSKRWIQSMFNGTRDDRPADPGLEVLKNRGAVQKNARFGRSLQIGDRKFDFGLFCCVPSRIRVRLPEAGQTFGAVIGMERGVQSDPHDWPSGPIWPEMIFRVKTGDKELFKSDVVRHYMPGIPIEVNLEGAREFVLEISGDKYTEWGEGDWADAQVTMASGRTVRLDELALPGEEIIAAAGAYPLSFLYDGKSSGELLPTWGLNRTSRQLDAARTEHSLIFKDPGTGLEVRWVGIEYLDFPTLEWTVYFKNTGTADTPIIEKIQALDLRLKRPTDTEFLLHHFLGSSCRLDDYRPMETVLSPGLVCRFAPATGYSTDPHMSYFNIDLQTGTGMILAIGWPGQWQARFARDAEQSLAVSCGQELTHFRLHAGEEVRSPLVVLQFWEGDWIRGQNIWRRWMLAWGLPKPDGKPLEPMLPGSNTDLLGYTTTSEQNQKEFIDRYVEEGIGINWWWIDYGWHAGGWEVAKDRYPNGIRAVSDYGRTKGMKTIVWFAPEPSPFGAKPEWIIKGKGEEPLCRGGDISALNFGNPEALRWVIDLIDKVITEEGIDCYRHDTGMGPLPIWRGNDSEDRQGITEIGYVTGFLGFYDELLRRHPNLLIDNCCRGGRRLDLETMRRSVPLWRSDVFWDPVSHQCQTYGIAFWLPYEGTGTIHDNRYGFRSNMTAAMVLNYDLRRKDLQYDTLRKLTQEWREIAANYLGDYYPLTPYSLDTDAWLAWQFDRPETGQGMVQVFRRAGEHDRIAHAEVMVFRLKGLEPDGIYQVQNLDEPEEQTFTGQELMKKGLRVSIDNPPAALIYTYQRSNPK